MAAQPPQPPPFQAGQPGYSPDRERHFRHWRAPPTAHKTRAKKKLMPLPRKNKTIKKKNSRAINAERKKRARWLREVRITHNITLAVRTEFGTIRFSSRFESFFAQTKSLSLTHLLQTHLFYPGKRASSYSWLLYRFQTSMMVVGINKDKHTVHAYSNARYILTVHHTLKNTHPNKLLLQNYTSPSNTWCAQSTFFANADPNGWVYCNRLYYITV